MMDRKAGRKEFFKKLGDISYFNPEQLDCINASGGTIVSAGAGSGKTSILVEHLLVHIHQSGDQWEQCLSKLFVMTFTRKAGSELKFRLSKRIEELKFNACEQGELKIYEYWKKIEEHLGLIFIGTIDSFYHQAIRNRKIFVNYPHSIEIVADQLLQENLQILIDRWAEELSEEEFTILIKHKEWFTHFTESLVRDVEFRSDVMKEMIDPKKLCGDWKQDFENFFQEKIAPLFQEIIKGCVSSSNDWCQLIICSSFSQGDFLAWFKLLIENPKRTPSKGADKDLIKSINDFRKEFFWFYDSLVLFNRYEADIEKIFLLAEKLKQQCRNFLLDYSKINFSGVQYLVKESIDQEQFQKSYFQDSYFLIDEFQDTSSLQEEIILKLVGGEKKRLFCVGDLKQAIYAFRGGDTNLMNQYMRDMPHKIYLNQNYRSHPSIIDFVNRTFSPHILNYVPQVSSRDHTDLPDQRVYLHHLDFVERGREGEVGKYAKYSKYIREENEIESILKVINYLQKISPTESVAILYKKNSLGRRLFFHLTDQDYPNTEINLVYQAKEDPYFSFLKLIFHLMESDQWTLSLDKTSKSIKGLNYYLKIFLSPALSEKEWMAKLKNFEDHISMYGINEAIQQLFLSLELSPIMMNSNLSLGGSYLNDFDSPQEILSRWDRMNEDTHYMKIPHQGSTFSSSISLSTIHQSKGLEYDHVIIVGAHEKNIFRRDGSEYIKGKISASKLSFKGRGKGEGDEEEERQDFMTPSYFQQYQNEKIELEAESKRLFYVATTRAKKSLHFLMNEKEDIQEGSWLSLVNLNEVNHFYWQLKMNSNPNRNSQTLSPFLWLSKKVLKKQTPNSVPALFEQERVKLIPDLTATKIATYHLCPKKYYFKHILDLEGDHHKKKNKIKKNNEKEITHPESSSERGMKFHDLMESILTRYGNHDLAFDEFLLWANNLIDENNYGHAWLILSSLYHKIHERRPTLHLEQELKFLIGPYMLNGTPDLFYFYSSPNLNSKSVEIVDFKTGRGSSTQKELYLIQLKIYAHGIFSLYKGENLEKCVLKIIYVDKNEEQNFEFSKLDVLHWADQFSQDFGEFSRKNLDHCLDCEFATICKSNEIMPSTQL
ncbi:MAG: UvrD-helicase domain-containing protein [Bacteriovoracaceae bacterium]|nr:UvrD-helicase domain-containing protein [Bacteriovoracaceae bacterium]